MDDCKPVAFMSYVHLDDDFNEGYLTRFCRLLSREVQLLMGEEFPIFQDRKDMEWGQSWKRRIEDSLDSTTFLIPIVTPNFFKSSYCRDELNRFKEIEKKLGRNDLILPIYFVETPLLQDESLKAEDELAQIIAAHHYADWRELRLEDLNSKQARKKIADLAKQVCNALNRQYNTRNTPKGPEVAIGPPEIQSQFMAAAQEPNKGIEVFFSYSHKDEDLRKELENHLSVLKNNGQISTWHDRKIGAGDEWRNVIDEHLNSAQIILLLISADFLASDYIRDIEMARAMQRHESGEARVIPILLRHVDWKDTSFAKLQILPSNARPITSYKWASPDVAFLDVEQGIKKVIEKINSGRLKIGSEPFTSTVDQMERGDFTTITEAIKNASPGAKILVRRGVYDEDIIIDKPLDITGDGDLGDVVVRAVENDVILFKTIRGKISNLMLKQYKTDKFGLNIIQGNLDVEDCDISSDNSSCIAIHGGAYPKIRNNKVHGSNQNGILIFDKGQGVIESNNIYGNALSGISIEADSNPTIINNAIHDNGSGVSIDNSKGLINNNEILNNSGMGVKITSGSKPNLINNKIYKNMQSGVYIYESKGLLRNNDISDNIDSGIVIHKGDPTLIRNYVHNNKKNISYVNKEGPADEEKESISKLDNHARRLLDIIAKRPGKYTTSELVDTLDLNKTTVISAMKRALELDPRHVRMAQGKRRKLYLTYVPDGDERAEEAFRQAKILLARGNYHDAQSRLFEIPREQAAIWERIKAEFSFIYNFDKEEDLIDWENRRGQIEWRRKVWAALAMNENSPPLEAPHVAEINETNKDEPLKKIVDLPPGDKGETLEEDTLKLLRHLFIFDKNEVTYPNKLRQQRRSSQFGCDIKLEFCRVANNQNVRCLVECKSHEGELPFSEVLQKLYDAKKNQIQIDHWILIAPRAKILGNVQDGMVEEWNINQDFPFSVQFWTKDREIWRFFGLEPEVYERWIDHPEGEKHPREWTEEERKEIREFWLGRLDPPRRLPQSWTKYVTDPSETGLFIESDDRKCLRELWQKNEYLPARALDSSRSPLSSSLTDTVRSWMNESGSRVCLILGDFGDGKTSFTYMFTRELLTEYKRNPNEGWIPVRFPLYQFARPNFNARDFLRDRLEEFGSNVSEWRHIIEQKNVLVILDGMDEMTKTLTTEAVHSAVDLLTDCCNHELEMVKKVIVTCRAPFFEELTQRQYVEDKLSKPRILYIERFDRRQVYNKLNELATTSEQKLKLHAMRQMHDPIGLAGKALFFKMVSENLANPKSDFSSETAIYQTYIDNSLTTNKKVDLLETGCQHTTRNGLREGLLEIMDRIAMEIHLSAKDYICLRNLAGAYQEGSTYARLLWQNVEDERSEGEDALHRVGVRSLLHKKTQGVDEHDAEAWPIEFCHRSMREYFVARGIEKALRRGVANAIEVISKVDFNHEILRFTAELMKKSKHNYQRTLLELAFMSKMDSEHEKLAEDEKQRRARLGRTSVTLLYRWLGKLPENDWSNLTLDGAQLAGADLTAKNFRNTSLRSANLNNAIFVDADFCGADLTGVRLEETGEVCSLAVPRNLDGFFAAYSDGSIRQWDLDNRSGEESRIIYEPTEKLKKQGKSLQIAALPGDGLCLYDRDHVIFLNAGQRYDAVGIFETQKRYLNVSFTETGITAVEKGSLAKCTAHIFDFPIDGLPSVNDMVVDACVHCERLGDEGLAAVTEDGHLVIYLKGSGEKEAALQSIQVAELTNISAITSISLVDTEQRVYLIACGARDGTVGLWRIQFSESLENNDIEKIFSKIIHQGAITSLSFLGPSVLLTSGKDNKIFLMNIPDAKKMPIINRVFELRLRCGGMKIDGIKGEREKAILEAAIKASI